jgi:hypothetical protein
MRVDASEKRMRRDGCFKLAAVRFNRMQLGFTHCCLLFEQSLAWNCRMRFLFYFLCRDRSSRLMLSGPADIARIIFHIDGAGGGTDPSRPAPENLSRWRSFVQNRLQVPTATGPA